MKHKIFFYSVIGACLFAIFGSWFGSGAISSGDSSFRFIESFEGVSFFPSVWNPHSGDIGRASVFVLAYTTYYTDLGLLLLRLFQLPWDIIIKVLWYLPFIFVSLFSSRYLLRTVFPSLSELYVLIGAFLFGTNTYILMVMGGGQTGVGMAYALAPFVLASFIKLIIVYSSISMNVKYQMSNIQYPIIAGLLFSVQVMVDPRLAYITIGAVLLYIVIKSSGHPPSPKASAGHSQVIKSLYALRLTLYTLVIPLGITGLLHTFWLLPFLFIGSGSIDQLGGVYTTGGAVQFFSFAKFEHALGLLHPNWPENIFGKVSFMKWEFLILPLLAFSSLLFVTTNGEHKWSYGQMAKWLKNHKPIEPSNHSTIIFFALLGLLGVFLAKGANEPFGQIYLWMFDHISGFIMFRDPTKWYLLVAISYSVLIPFSIYSIYQWLISKIKNQKSKIHSTYQKYIPNLFLLFAFLYLLFLVRPALLGQLGGTFRPQAVPEEYVQLKDFLVLQPEYFRTFWVTQPSRYAFQSYSHPKISANDYLALFQNDELLQTMDSKKTLQLLQESAVKYVIVPYDSRGEIFIEDRKYNDGVYQKVRSSIDAISWLQRVDSFGRLVVYEVPNPKDHFWSPSENIDILYAPISPTKYSVSIQNAKKGDVLVFSEGYDKGWAASAEGVKVKSQNYHGRFNSFVLPEGSYVLEVVYQPQRLVEMGAWISTVVLLFVIGSLLSLRRKK